MLGRRSRFDYLSLIYFVLIPLGLLCIISGFRAIYFLKTMPLVPLENSEKGDHVKVTALRVVDVIDTEVTYKWVRHHREERTEYYYLAEIKEVEGECIVLQASSDPYKMTFPRELEGVVYWLPREEIQKAEKAVRSYPGMSLYGFGIHDYRSEPPLMIFGICIEIIGIGAVIVSLRLKRKTKQRSNSPKRKVYMKRGSLF